MNPEAYRQDYEELHRPVSLQFYPKRRARWVEELERIVVALAIICIIFLGQIID